MLAELLLERLVLVVLVVLDVLAVVLVLTRVLVVLVVTVVVLVLAVALVDAFVVLALVVLAVVVLAVVLLALGLELLDRLLVLPVVAVELELCARWRSSCAFGSAPSALPLPDVADAGGSPPHAATDMHAATDIDAAIAPQCPRVTTFMRVLFMRDLSLRYFWKSSPAAMD